MIHNWKIWTIMSWCDYHVYHIFDYSLRILDKSCFWVIVRSLHKDIHTYKSTYRHHICLPHHIIKETYDFIFIKVANMEGKWLPITKIDNTHQISKRMDFWLHNVLNGKTFLLISTWGIKMMQVDPRIDGLRLLFAPYFEHKTTA